MDHEAQSFQGYIERTAMIRRMSSPSVEEIEDADAYGERLRDNFLRIGQLAQENRRFLDTEFYPLIHSDVPLNLSQINDLMEFGKQLINAEHVESLDLPIMSLVSERLVEEARQKRDLTDVIRQMDARISTCYELMNMTLRITAHPEIAAYYRQKGIAIAHFFYDLVMDRERFSAIDDEECRHMALTNARYGVVFYEGACVSADEIDRMLGWLETMLSVARDSFYREAAGADFDWDYFTLRVLEYYAQATEEGVDASLFTPAQLRQVANRADELCDLCDRLGAEYCEDIVQRDYIEAVRTHDHYLAGDISRAEFRERLLRLYRNRDSGDYTANGGYMNLRLPVNFIRSIDRNALTAQDRRVMRNMYGNAIAYLSRMPNSETLTAIAEYFTFMLDEYIEIPSGLSFEHMVLQCMAAIHPPTYVHSVMVAQLTECLCDHLIRRSPELLVGVLGAKCAEEVAERREEIVRFAYHAALCHDFGKIAIIDTVLVYGRNLLDMEFNIIKTHPRMGCDLLMRHPTTRPYAEVALGHHRWYDNSRGYPEAFDTSQSPLKPLIDLVLCADCLDAATDSVGRSYSHGKTLQTFMEELEEGSGTHYAPWLLPLLSDPDVQRDIKFMLSVSRQHNYRDTYYLLRNLQEQVI